MPNYCNNRLVITGNKNELEKIRAKIGNPNQKSVDFEVLRPMPSILKTAPIDFSDETVTVCRLNKERLSKLLPQEFADKIGIDLKLLLDDGFCPTMSVEDNLERRLEQLPRFIDNKHQGIKKAVEVVRSQHEDDCEAQTDYRHWREFAMSEWGAKSNPVTKSQVSMTDSAIQADFLTAYHFPNAWMDALIKFIEAEQLESVTLTFDYAEPVLNFGGSIKYSFKGELDVQNMNDEQINAFVVQTAAI